jgi:hypothetical protein
LTGDVISTNSLALHPKNVSQFDLLLKGVPNVRLAGPLLLRVGNQDLRIFARRLPEALRLSLVADIDRSPHWEAEEIKAETAAERATEDRYLGEMPEDMPALPDERLGGVARLLAYAARRATRAQVALVPACAVESGQSRGTVTFADMEGWSRDSELATTTLSTRAIVEALEWDYAGPRLLVSDGVGAILASPSAQTGGVDEPESPSTGSIKQNATADAAPVPKPDDLLAKRRVFTSTLLDAAGPEVVVVSWRGLLENPNDWLSGRPVGQDPLAPSPTNHLVVNRCKITQQEALLQLFRHRPQAPVLPPDIRSLPHKKPGAEKTKLSSSDKHENRP